MFTRIHVLKFQNKVAKDSLKNTCRLINDKLLKKGLYSSTFVDVNDTNLYVINTWKDEKTSNEWKNKNLEISDVGLIYINRGPGSFAGIRNSLSTIKAIHMIKKIDYFCFSFKDFEGENDIKYENIPHLCSKFSIKKNLIKPHYIS